MMCKNWLEKAEEYDLGISAKIEEKGLKYAFDPSGKRAEPFDMDTLLDWVEQQVGAIDADMALAEDARRRANASTDTNERNRLFAEARAAEARANARALSMYVKLRANKEDLDEYHRSIFDRTSKLVRDGNGTKIKFSSDALALMRGMSKMLLVGRRDIMMYNPIDPNDPKGKEYDPNNPITIASMDHYGRNYCIPPDWYLFDCALSMADNDNFVTRKTRMQYNNGVWSMDCVSVTRLMYKNWLDKDVYNFYVAEGFPMAMVGTQAYMIPESNRGVFPTDKNGKLDVNAVEGMIKAGLLPAGTVIHADNYIGRKSGGVKGQDGVGDTHQKIYVGLGALDDKGNIVRYTGAPGQVSFPVALNSSGGEYGNVLELQDLRTAPNVVVYATPPHRTPGFDIQPEWGGSQ